MKLINLEDKKTRIELLVIALLLIVLVVVGIRAFVIVQNNKEAKEHFKLGCKYSEEGKNTQAELELKKAIALNPSFVAAYEELGGFYYESKQINKAITIHKQAIANNPHDSTAYSSLGEVLFIKQKYKETIFYLKKAVELKPSDIVCRRYLALSYEKTNQKELAIKQWKSLLKVSPDDKVAKGALERLGGGDVAQ